MAHRVNRNQLDRDNASDDSEAIEDNNNFEDSNNIVPVDEESGEDLEQDIDRDEAELQEENYYEQDSADQESYSEIHDDQRRAAEEELDEIDRLKDRKKKTRGGVAQTLLNVFDDDSSDFQNFGRRVETRMENLKLIDDGEEDMEEMGEAEEEEKFEEEKFLDKEQAKGRLHQWIQEPRTIRFIRFRFRNFLNNFKKENQNISYYKRKIQKMCDNNKSSLEIEYSDLSSRTNMQSILVWVLFEPTLIFPELNKVVREVVLKMYPEHDNISKEFHVRVSGLPYLDKLRDLRHRNIGHLLKIQGVVTKRSAVYNQMRESYYICNRCGTRHGPVLEDNPDVKKLGQCFTCQSRGPYTLDQSNTIYRNYQKITVQESPGQVPAGRVPTQKEVILLGDNIDICRPGDEVEITGIYTFRYDYILNVKHGFPLFSTIIEANHVKCLADIENITIEPSEMKQIEYWSKKPNIKDIIINSMAPSIHGHVDIKTAIALAMLGGESKDIGGKHRTRGDINILIVGDPGVAKSQFLKSVQKTFQRTVYTTGKGATAVGLTASVKRDMDSKEWTLEGGALVIADQGICLIDEFDKMNDYDRTSIHEAMEQQSISISKAGIVATLQARCSVIAAANPKTGRYNSQVSFMENVDLSDPIMSRFDILCVVKDEISPEKDARLAQFVINSHIKSHPKFAPLFENNKIDSLNQSTGDSQMDEEMDEEQAQLRELHTVLKSIQLPSQNLDTIERMPMHLLKKYIIHARSLKPKITQIDSEKIQTFYSDLRQESSQLGGLAIAVRHIESILRIAEAFAKMSLRSEVKSDDVDRAISVVLKSFIQSQKQSVSSNVQKKFKKYIIESKDNNQLLMKLLDDLMMARQKMLIESDVISIPLSSFQSRAEQYQIDNISKFLESDAFKTIYKRQGDTIQLVCQLQQRSY